MRSFQAIQEISADRIVAPRPLLLIDKHGGIERTCGGVEASAGEHCWETFGCTWASLRGCPSIRPLQPGPHIQQDREPAAGLDGAQSCLVAPLTQSSKGFLIWGPSGYGSPTVSGLLHFICELGSSLLAPDFAGGGETMLELIRTLTGADDCELFLADLYGKEMLLTACVGTDSTALRKRSRFGSGDGLPGLAFAQARPVTTLQLDPRDRFAHGQPHPPILAFVSVPISGPDGRVVGCIDLGWRHSDVPVQGLAEVLWSALSSLGSSIYAAYWMLRQNIVRSYVPASELACADLLKALHEAVGADAGSLIIWDERDRKAQRRVLFGAMPPTCPWLASAEASPCTSRINESGYRLLALGPAADRRPGPCRQMQFDGSSVCCVPIVGHPSRMGRLLVGFRSRRTDDSSRLLVPLQVMAEQVGMQLPEVSILPAIQVQEPAYPPLAIRCFGHFEVSIGERMLGLSSFPRRDALMLLKMLVLRAGKQIRRERLIDWLWPDASERSGLNRLHGVVHALRGAIEPYASERRWTYLLNEGETYMFSPDRATSVDLISFQENLALARRDLREGAFAPQATHYLEQAVELYRGDLYEDDQYCEWCDVERITLQREFMDALASLARTYLTLGEAKRANEALRRALVYDPSREDLHNELIRCLMRQRRYNEAKDQVRECVRNLRENVGVEPSTETQRLYHALFNGSKG